MKKLLVALLVLCMTASCARADIFVHAVGGTGTNNVFGSPMILSGAYKDIHYPNGSYLRTNTAPPHDWEFHNTNGIVQYGPYISFDLNTGVIIGANDFNIGGDAVVTGGGSFGGGISSGVNITAAGSLNAGTSVNAKGFNSTISHVVGSMGNASSLGSSPLNWTNNSAVTIEVYMTQGAAYTVSKNGLGIYASLAGNDYLVLQPGSYFTVTFSGSGPIISTNSW